MIRQWWRRRKQIRWLRKFADPTTCMCGSSVDGHGMWDNHDPVSQADYVEGQIRDIRAGR